MLGTKSDERRTSALVVVAVAAVMIAAWLVGLPRSSAAPAPAAAAATTAAIGDGFPWEQLGAGGTIYAKYDGIDGESQAERYKGWIDVLRVEWGAEKPAAATGVTRRRGAPVIEDLVLTFDYEKASPKLEEKMLKGEVIPKLEIEFVESTGDAQQTYLKIEMKNVLVTSIHFDGMQDGGRPTMVFGNNFEEIKVTYTEYDANGTNKGNVEYSWKVERGTT